MVRLRFLGFSEAVFPDQRSPMTWPNSSANLPLQPPPRSLMSFWYLEERKYSRRRGVFAMHWMVAFRKQVLPRFCRPTAAFALEATELPPGVRAKPWSRSRMRWPSMNSSACRVAFSSPSSQSTSGLLRWKTSAGSEMPCRAHAVLFTSPSAVARLLSRDRSMSRTLPPRSVLLTRSCNGYISSSQRPSSSMTWRERSGPGPPYQACKACHARLVMTS
mmetsp:Transcript_47846/g.152644  ORF Transcript_47846/g.152644 Transcript_47846/m.152644 type:complete len:218 (+) Transcript_47846:319-972(+)